MNYGGATLTLTPWAHEALSLDEMRSLGYRAVELHCRVRVGGRSSGGPWTVRVYSWATTGHGPVYRVEWYRRHGHLADLIDKALDEYQRRYVYSPEELAQIQRQSA